MAKRDTPDTLDVAMLPLGDGRQLLFPLQVLAEVRQLPRQDAMEDNAGILEWRGMELPVSSLDEACGLAQPAPEQLTTVAVFRAGKDSAEGAFRALAFCGTASSGRVSAELLEPAEAPAEGRFLGATELHEQDYLIPDLPAMLFAD